MIETLSSTSCTSIFTKFANPWLRELRGMNFKAWIRNPRSEFWSGSMIDPDERAQIGSHRVVLSGDPGLQIRDFGERILRAIPVQESAAGLEAQINSSQSLDVTVVQ